MGWKDTLKKVTNVVLPGSWDVGEKLGNSLKDAWNDYTGKTAVDAQNEYNMRMWQMQNEYNTPANQMQRFLQAGLNPNLIYSQGNAGNANSAPEMTAHQGSFAKALSLAKLVLDLKQISAQNKNLKAQADNIESQTALHNADVEYKQAILDFYHTHGYFPGQSNVPVNVVKDVMNSAPVKYVGEGAGRVLGDVVGSLFYGPEPDYGDERALRMAGQAADKKGLSGRERIEYIDMFLRSYKATH